LRAVDRVEERVVLGGFRVLRDRVLEEPLPLEVRLGEPDDEDEDVLLLRDPGGEDVRVAMLDTLVLSHTRPTDHTSACRGGRPGPSSEIRSAHQAHAPVTRR